MNKNMCVFTCLYLFHHQCFFISGNHYPWVIISTNLTWWWTQKGVQKLTQHTTESLQCSRETVSLLASYSAQDSHLHPKWAIRGKPPHEILLVPLSECGFEASQPESKVVRDAFKAVKSQHKTKTTTQYLHFPAVKACSLKAIQVGGAIPTQVKPCVSFCTSGHGTQSAGSGEPLDTVHSLKHPRDPREFSLLQRAVAPHRPCFLSPGQRGVLRYSLGVQFPWV